MPGGVEGEYSTLLDDSTPPDTPDGLDDRERGLSESSSSTTLCDETRISGKAPEKPFPWRFSISVYVLTCIMPLCFELIFPFVNQMILENGITSDPERVGFYSGVIESVFALTSFLSIMPVSYLSDHLGRKPVILAGTFGLAISIALFGMAKSYWLMILTRLIGGTLGGTNAAMKVTLTEAIEKSQQGLAFSGQVVAYRMGQIIGQPMGGLLSHPERNFKLFDTPFWNEYPFALPCFISAAFAIFGVIFGWFAIQETLPSRRKTRTNTNYGAISSSDSTETTVTVKSKRSSPSVRSILNKQVIGALVASALLAFSSEMIFALYSLFAFTPVASGGLGYNETQIGAQLGFRSISNILVIFFYAPLDRRLGTMKAYQLTMSFWPVSIGFFPLLNALARSGWQGTLAFKMVMGLFFTIWSFACLSWTSASIVLNNSAPSAEGLSVITGLGQMATTLPLAIAPAFITSLFAFSIKHDVIFHGNLVYVVQLVVGIAGAIYTLTLKEATHDWREDAKLRDEET